MACCTPVVALRSLSSPSVHQLRDQQPLLRSTPAAVVLVVAANPSPLPVFSLRVVGGAGALHAVAAFRAV